MANKYFSYCLMYFTILQFLNTCSGAIAYYEVVSLSKVNTLIELLFWAMLFVPILVPFSILKDVKARMILRNMKQVITNYWWKYLGMVAIMLVLGNNGTQNLYADISILTMDSDPSNVMFYFSFNFAYNMLCDRLSFLFFVFVPFICDMIASIRGKI